MNKYFEAEGVLIKVNTESMKALLIKDDKMSLVLLDRDFLKSGNLKKITKLKFNEAFRSQFRKFKSFV